MGISTPDNQINSFIELPSHLKTTIEGNNIIIDDEKLEKLKTKFKEQFPKIDEKCYKLLKREDKKIGINYEEVNKKNVEFYELLNYSFFNSILQEIKKENKDISEIKIYNTYSYTDRKTGVDYSIFIKLENGNNIAFGLDLKNGKNSEENYNEIITGIFTLITQDTSGKTLNYEGIKKNIEISKNLYNNVTKHKRKYTIGINYRNQETLNKVITKYILTNRLDTELRKLYIFEHIKLYLNNIVNNEIEGYKNGLLGNIINTKSSAQELLEKGEELELQAKIIKEEGLKRKKEEERRKKEKKEIPENLNQNTKTKTRKYEKGKKYTNSKLKKDLLFILDMNNKINITQDINRIIKNIKSNKKVIEFFNEIYNSINNNKIKIPGEKKTIRIITLTKPQLNRFNKIYNELQK